MVGLPTSWHHLLAFTYQGDFLELEIFWEVLTDSAIACTGLRDQEVQQDDTCDKDDASPHKPEKNVNIPWEER